MLTIENRPLYKRDHLRYPSDRTDAEWAVISPARRGGNKRSDVNRRIIQNFPHGRGRAAAFLIPARPA